MKEFYNNNLTIITNLKFSAIMKMMNLKSILTFLIFSVFANMSFAQQGTLAGTIMDGEFNEGLMGANILIKELGTGDQTDLDGKFTIKLDAGTYTVEVSYVCLLYTSPSPRDATLSRMPSSA